MHLHSNLLFRRLRDLLTLRTPVPTVLLTGGKSRGL
jgi:hypothetical protein